ncbi:MAG: ribosome maturation factor RimM [Eubacteriales bacterium]
MNFIEIGIILKPQGIKGEVKVKPFTDDVNRFLDLKNVFLDENGYDKREVKTSRVHNGFAYLLLDKVSSANDAENLRGFSLYIDRKNTIKLKKGAYFICDLIGLNVEDDKGNILGQLSDVMQHGAADVYVVKSINGNFSFPALKRVITKIDLENNLMRLNKKSLDEVAVYEV